MFDLLSLHEVKFHLDGAGIDPGFYSIRRWRIIMITPVCQTYIVQQDVNKQLLSFQNSKERAKCQH